MPIGKVRSHVRRAILASLLVTTVVAPPAPTLAAEKIMEEVHDFNIATVDAATAIQRFGVQSGVQILIDADGLRGRQLNSVVGRHSVDEGLQILLAGTGLSYRYVGDRGVALVSAQGTGSFDPEEEEEPSDAPSRLVVRQEEEVIVTGSYLPRREVEGYKPVIMLDRKKLDTLGVTTVSDALRYAPQQTFDTFGGFGGARTPSLRGYSTGTTKVLINGDPTVTSALQVATNGFDLNSIPLGMVDRIEVLPDSASAQYGADAVGGVINLILKPNVEQRGAEAYFGGAQGGGDEKRFSFSIGGGERLRGWFGFDAYARDVLMGTERDSFRNRNFSGQPLFGTDFRQPLSNPGSVCTADGSPLPGLSTPCATPAAGGSGVGLSPADFVPGRALTSLGIFTSVVPESERYSGFSQLEYDLTEKLTLSAQVLYTAAEDERLLTPSALFGAPVAANNPFNIFGVPLTVNYLFTGIGPQQDQTEERMLHAVAALKGTMGSWKWKLSGLRITGDGEGRTLGVVNTAAAIGALSQTDPNLALNVFGGPGGSPALLSSLLLTPRQNNFESNALQFGGLIRGPLFDVPAGAVEAMVGAGWREEEILLDVAAALVQGDRNTNSAFTEIRLPIVSAEMNIPALEALTVTLAGRFDDFSDFGSNFSPQFGLQWYPVKSLMVRGSYGESYRAPPLFLLNSPQRVLPLTIADPQQGNATVAYTSISGGNPNLDAEESESFTVGLVYAPDPAAGLQIGLNYWETDTTDRLLVVSPNAILLANFLDPTQFVGRVVRDATGALVSIDSTNVNFGRLQASGFDLNASDAFNTRLGRLTFSVLGTLFDRFDQADAPNAPAAGRVNLADFRGSIPEWRATATFGWEYRGVGVSLVGRHTPSYRDTQVNVRNGRSVDSNTLLDVQFSLNADEFLPATSTGWMSGWILRTGAANVLDEEPSYSEVTLQGADASQADFRQRFIYVSIAKKF